MADAAPEGIAGETAQLATLQARLKEAKDRVARLARMRRAYWVFGSVAGFLGVFAIIINPFVFQSLISSSFMSSSALTSVLRNMPLWGLVTMAYGGGFFAMGAVVDVRRAELDAKEIEDEIDLLQMKSASLEQKAHKLLRIQQGQLSRYLEVILQQSRGIFVVGVAAMLVGVGVVVFTIWETRNMGPEADTIQKAIVAAVGAVGAILVNYVAAIYLKMFSDIGGAVQKSIGSLSQSTNVNFANVLVSNITTEEGRNEALKQIALGISKVGASSG
jgi:hypothetical protein